MPISLDCKETLRFNAGLRSSTKAFSQISDHEVYTSKERIECILQNILPSTVSAFQEESVRIYLIKINPIT